MTRDDVLKEFYATPSVPGGATEWMADEIVRLREERDAIERDHHEAVGIWRYMLRELEATAEASDALNGTLNDAIRAAVKVAEQEVSA